MKNRIRELRQGNGITQAELAKFLGVAQNTLSYWEQGRYDIDNSSLQKIADYFNCSVDYILCRAEIPRREVNEDFLGELLTDHEKELVRAYRNQPDMQESICRILGIEYPKPVSGLTKEASTEDDDTVQVYMAARSKNGAYEPAGYRSISKELLEKLQNAPEVKDGEI